MTNTNVDKGNLETAIEILQSLSGHYECAICLDIIDNAYVVPDCQHRFCGECIKESVMKCDNTCPECRTHIPTYRSLKEDSKFNDLVQGCIKVLELLKNESSCRKQNENANTSDAKIGHGVDDKSFVSELTDAVAKLSNNVVNPLQVNGQVAEKISIQQNVCLGANEHSGRFTTSAVAVASKMTTRGMKMVNNNEHFDSLSSSNTETGTNTDREQNNDCSTSSSTHYAIRRQSRKCKGFYNETDEYESDSLSSSNTETGTNTDREQNNDCSTSSSTHYTIRRQSRKRKGFYNETDEYESHLKRSAMRTKIEADSTAYKTRNTTTNNKNLRNHMSTSTATIGTSSHEAPIAIDLLPNPPTSTSTRSSRSVKVTPPKAVVKRSSQPATNRNSSLSEHESESEGESESESEHENPNNKDRARQTAKKRTKKSPFLVVIVGGSKFKSFNYPSKRSTFEERVQDLLEFKAKYGHLQVYDTKKYPSLVKYCSRMRSSYAAYQRGDMKNVQGLDEERIQRLNEIGFLWSIVPIHFKPFDHRFEDLVKFKAKFGHAFVPAVYSENPSLGHWCMRMRSLHRKYHAGEHQTCLNEERIRRLNDIGFVWEPNTRGINGTNFDEYMDWLKDFKRSFGHCEVPKSFKNQKLVRWVYTMRTERRLINRGERSSRLDAEKIKRLDEIGFAWECKRFGFDARLRALEAFKEKHGHTRVPTGESLGKWCSVMRAGLRIYLEGHGFSYSLNEERIRKIQEAGIEPLRRKRQSTNSLGNLLE